MKSEKNATLSSEVSRSGWKAEKFTIKIQCFGIAGEICGDFIEAKLETGSKVGRLQEQLRERYPELAELRHFFIARNQEYAAPEEVIAPGDELVIIPPVAGG